MNYALHAAEQLSHIPQLENSCSATKTLQPNKYLKKKKKKKLEYYLTLYTKTNSKLIKDQNLRPDTIKLVEENTVKALFDINHSRVFF